MSTTYRVLSDQLYRSVATVTTSNAVTEAYDTDAYGNTLCYSGPGTDGLWFTDDDVQTNNPINTTIFTGRQYDPESLLYWYRARFYSPQMGRFISRDPLTDAELSQGPNLYEYVWDNPSNRLDPNGLECGSFNVHYGSSISGFGYGALGYQAAGDNKGSFVVEFYDANCCPGSGNIILRQAVTQPGSFSSSFDSAGPEQARANMSTPGGVPPPDVGATASQITSGTTKYAYSDSPGSDAIPGTFDFEVCAICKCSGVETNLGCTTFSYSPNRNKISGNPGPSYPQLPGSLYNNAVQRWTNESAK